MMLKISFRLLVATMALGVSLGPAHAQEGKKNCPNSIFKRNGVLKTNCSAFVTGLTCGFDIDGDGIRDTIYACEENSEGGGKTWENQNYVPLLINKIDDTGELGGLDLCEGDCNSDEQCNGDLRCFIRDSDSTSEGAEIPGCIRSIDDNGKPDFCVNPYLYPCGDDEKVCVDPTKTDTSTCETTTCVELFREYPDKCFCDFYSLRCRETCDYCREIDEQDIKRCPLIDGQTFTDPGPIGNLCSINPTPGYDCTTDFCADSEDKIEGQKTSVNKCSKINTPRKVKNQCKKTIVETMCPGTCEVPGCD